MEKARTHTHPHTHTHTHPGVSGKEKQEHNVTETMQRKRFKKEPEVWGR